MLERENRKLLLGQKLSRQGAKDTKSVEADLKLLNKWFMERRMFIKFHMIYKRFGDKADFRNNSKNDICHPAAPFMVRNICAHSSHLHFP